MSAVTVNDSTYKEPSNKYIVHRENEWELIEAEIRNRRNGPLLANSIIVLFGTVGIGKTTFLHRTLVPLINKYFPSLPLATIDFDKDQGKVDRRYDSPQGRGQVVIDLLNELIKRSGKFATELVELKLLWEQALAHASEQPKTKANERPRELVEAEEKLASLFCKYVGSLILERDHRPLIFIMDTAEEMDRDLMGWIQESLQTPTTDTGYVLWIVASRQPIDCQPFFLRPRYHWHPLKPFGDQQIQEQIPERADLLPVFKHFSYGLPSATTELASTILKIEQKEKRTLGPAELEEKHARELIVTLADLLDLKRYLGDLKADLREGLQILSPLRLFNVTIVAQLLPDMLPEHFKRATIGAEALYVIQQMVRTKLVSWDRERRGYVIEEPIRQIISLVLEHKQSDFYAEIHQWAEVRYREWAENIEAKRLDYIIEALYHKTIILSRIEKVPEPVLPLVKMLEDMVHNYYVNEDGRVEEAIDELKQQLVSDQDFVELLRPKGMKYLLEALQR